MFYMFSNYFIDNKTGILDTNTIPMLLSLFSQADAKNLSQTDNLYSLVIDENGEFNEERYEFAYNALAQLQKIKQKEISKKSQNEDQVIISAMITSITGAIMESVSLENKGKFNMQKAQNLLDYLLDNINKVGTLYKNEGLQPISLTPQNMTFE